MLHPKTLKANVYSDPSSYFYELNSLSMISININNRSFFVQQDSSILEACKLIGITIPRFCYHESLSIAGNCRMCLVELENLPKPAAACLTLVAEDLSIFLNTPVVKKARENIIEFLLLNHPLDCPICDQGVSVIYKIKLKILVVLTVDFFFQNEVLKIKVLVL